MNSVRNSVENSVENSVWNSVWNSVRNSVWNSVSQAPNLSFYNDYSGLSWESWLSFYDYFTRISIINNEDFNKYLAFNKKGVWQAMFFEHAVFICTLPTKILKDERGRLHSLQEPAAQWINGEGYYFIHGVEFKKDLWDKLVNKELTPNQAIALPNVEQRTVALKIMGNDIILQALDSRVAEERKAPDGSGAIEQLLEVRLNDESNLESIGKFIKVKDYSTDKLVLLRVPPTIKSIEEGRAWTFDVPPDEFKPLMET